MTQSMQIGNHTFQRSGHTYIMGILNVTPDSFFDGGKWTTIDKALFCCAQMIEEGADIIDVGGESTRPGYTPLPEAEELVRICTLLSRIKARFDIPLSVDTYKSKVALAALAEGADLINDIWGLKKDPAMAKVIAESGAACCLMHNRKDADYTDFFAELKQDLRDSVSLALQAGIGADKIILDPGVGFVKSVDQNLVCIAGMKELAELGYPLLLAASNKSVIGNVLGLPVDQRLEGTLATTVLATLQGCTFVRVHQVKENKRMIQMTEAVMRCGKRA